MSLYVCQHAVDGRQCGHASVELSTLTGPMAKALLAEPVKVCACHRGERLAVWTFPCSEAEPGCTCPFRCDQHPRCQCPKPCKLHGLWQPSVAQVLHLCYVLGCRKRARKDGKCYQHAAAPA